MISRVSGHEGLCKPVRINNDSFRRIHGWTGFFRLVSKKTFLGFSFSICIGEEFHGVLKDGVVYSTEGVYGKFVVPN
jgi:hypothetical protein